MRRFPICLGRSPGIRGLRKCSKSGDPISTECVWKEREEGSKRKSPRLIEGRVRRRLNYQPKRKPIVTTEGEATTENLARALMPVPDSL